MSDDVQLAGFGAIPEPGRTKWQGAFFGVNPSSDGYDMGFDTEQKAKEKFLIDLLSFLSANPRIVMYWRRLPMLTVSHDFDSEVVKYKYTGRIAYTNLENV